MSRYLEIWPLLIRRARLAPGVVWRAACSEWRRLREATDTKRWSSEINLHEAWRSRTCRLTEYVPSDCTVLELGCGAARTLELLPPTCRYIPSDVVARTPDTFVCDLNSSELPEFPASDVVLMSGVLEYVVDVPRLFRHLTRAAETNLLLLSYDCHKRGQSRMSRRQLGWMSDLTHEDIVALAQSIGFRIEVLGHWQNQSLYALRRNES